MNDSVGCDRIESNLLQARPIRGIYFQVMVEHNQDHAAITGKVPADMIRSESDPISTFKQAYEAASEFAQSLQGGIENSQIEELDLNEADDGYFLYLMDQHEEVISRVGISMCDYRRRTIH